MHLLNSDIIATSYGHTIVLVEYGGISQGQAVGARDVESISVVSGGQVARPAVGCVACCVVQDNVFQKQTIASRDAEAVDRVVLDVEVSNDRAVDGFAHDEKVVGPGHVSK